MKYRNIAALTLFLFVAEGPIVLAATAPDIYELLISNSHEQIYLETTSVESDDGLPMFNLVTNTKKSDFLVAGKKVRSIVTGHFLDCDAEQIFTSWMEVFEHEFGEGYLSQVADLQESQAKNFINTPIFDRFCK